MKAFAVWYYSYGWVPFIVLSCLIGNWCGRHQHPYLMLVWLLIMFIGPGYLFYVKHHR